MKPRLFLPIMIAGFLSATSFGDHDHWSSLINRLARDGHSRSQLERLFHDAGFDPEPVRSKLTSLFEAKFSATRIRSIQEGLHALGYNPGPPDGLTGPKTRQAIRAFQRDNRLSVDGRASSVLLQEVQYKLHPESSTKPYREKRQPVYESILQEERLSEAWEFWLRHREALEQVRQEYGVPEEIAVAILAVETRVGLYLGEKKAFLTLASLASANDLERVQPMFSEYTLTREREKWLNSTAGRISNWAYRELSALLEYADSTGVNVQEIPSSIYGAIGVSQFMPSNAIRFGVDGNHDGIVNLFEVEDALSSMGNFLKANGWRADLASRSGQARVIYRYNRSRAYVNTVLTVAEALRGLKTSGNLALDSGW
jgi:membrane-bound lytic murein transglycosylase B